MHFVERTFTEILADRPSDQIHVRPQPLSAYQNLSAYVLLGNPGAGKTTAFEQEASRPDAFYITARDLITFEDRSEWHGKTLFIDGLDEIRAGSQDARTPFDVIRARLDKLGRPRFRLSCREADWFGAADQEHLKSVSPDGQVTILHIDPLTEADIVEILNNSPRVLSTKEFMRWAEQKGLDELLTNPQILDMLVNAVADGKWPETRKQTFELACRTIIREHNQEHIDSKRGQPADENQQLNAVGYLYAVQLIAGNAGYALSSDMSNNDFPYLGNSAFDNIGLLNEVARTKLFKAPIEGRIVPIHRHVAEYLAARYLTERIEQAGLPIGRILALITGEDGVVVAELRGLSAWLAALCKSQRSAIIERDPLGVVLYGDVRDFTNQDKRRVLDGLREDYYPWFGSAHWTASPFGALATLDMEQEFCTILTASDRSEAHQALADCVLNAMTYGVKFPSLDDTLLKVARDATWWLRVRRAALKVIQRNSEGKPGTAIHLKMLTEEINNDTVADADDELLGHLLTVLYPQSISAADVLDYLHAPKQRNLIGSYLRFWDRQLLDKSSDSDVSVLLDELATRLNTVQSILGDHHLHGLAAGLLSRGLETHGESVDSMRLYQWLGVGLDTYGHSHSGTKTDIDSIRSWLERHPVAQKDIIGIGLDSCVEKENFRICMFKAESRLFHAKSPDDFGQWSLERMQTATNDDVAHYLLQEAVRAISYQEGNANLTLETIEEIAGQDPKYKGWLSDIIFCPIEQEEREYTKMRRLREAEDREKMQGWIHVVKSHQTELREGRAYPRPLHDLATAYFGHFIESEGDTPIERLQNFLGHDEELVQSVREGLRRSLERNDIPKVTDIIRLYVEGKTSLLSRPFLAGLEEITQASPENVKLLSDNQIRQAVAFYLVDGTGENPDWYKLLLASHPDLVAEVTIAYVTAALRSNKEHITGLYALAYTDEYSSVARLASLIMLNAFPVRSTNQQLASLDDILKAALRYADRQELISLIKKKLNLRSMNVAQRVRWLAAGLIVVPEKYLEPIATFAKGREKRIQHLAGFLTDWHGQWSPLDDLPVSALGLLVGLIGGFFAPYTHDDGASWVTPAMSASDIVNRLINRLGSQPEKAATDTLDTLSADPGLYRWQTALRNAQSEQRTVRREASFHHPDISQVYNTLNNQSPANAGDLAALTIDILKELAHRMRNGNTDDYRQFWNEGPRRQLDSPKHEDACRDALLSDLQLSVARFGIDAQPEGHYADNKRADIRIAFGGSDGFEVPIEIKKNNHRNLWHAIHDQLIVKYTRDPHANGFGIYLIFWFGSGETQPPPSGQRPRTANELEQRLTATLSVNEKRKISVCVIDVTNPE